MSLDRRRSCSCCTAMRCLRPPTTGGSPSRCASEVRTPPGSTFRYHLRRTLPGQRSGDGYFSLDPAHIRAVVRQSVEDAAAVIAWARAEVSPARDAWSGVSLGGSDRDPAGAQLELDRVIAVAPFCDPATTLSQRPPTPSLRHLGMIGEYSGSWGPDRASCRSLSRVDARAAAWRATSRRGHRGIASPWFVRCRTWWSDRIR